MVFMKEKATSFDIAHLAGVSQSTVSRALNNSPLVNQETRDRVQRIARELNYKVDKNASNLRKQKSSTIALLLFEDPTSDDSMINPFFLAMLGSITRACAQANYDRSITRACAQANYDLLVSFQNLDDDWHAEYEDSNKADGIILLGYGDYTDYQNKVAQLESQGTHFVRWGAPDEAHPGVSIGCDNYQGGQSITSHLIGLLQSHGLDQSSVQRNAISTEDAGSEAVKSLLQSGELPQAIVCASDLIAMGVLRALRQAKVNVPDDVAVVGYDNIAVSAYTTPSLTTVQQNTKLAGELLVNTLLKAINNEDVQDYLMPADIIIRQSCGSE